MVGEDCSGMLCYSQTLLGTNATFAIYYSKVTFLNFLFVIARED